MSGKAFSVRMRAMVLAAAFCSCGLFFSCQKNDGQLEMPELAPEALSPRISWALVSDPYVACREEAGYESQTISSFRKGEIYEIKGRRSVMVDDAKETWYALGDGWVPSSAVRVYSNKLRAERAREKS